MSKSVMKHQFSQVPSASIPRSKFNRSHTHKTTFDAGKLIPIMAQEALPGDTWNCKLSIYSRMATPIVPIMDNLHMDIHHFAVPLRLVWDNFQKFMGEQDNPGDSIDYLVPQIQPALGSSFLQGNVADHFGIPPGIVDIQFNALFHRAYQLIWNEWFRDQNLQSSFPIDKGDGPTIDNGPQDILLPRGKRHDYFTSCLVSPQKGEGVTIPIGDTAALDIQFTPDGNPNILYKPDGTSPTTIQSPLSRESSAGPLTANSLMDTTEGELVLDNSNSLGGFADLSTATATTINSLRQAFQMQRMLERDARGGTRYTEILKAHFGITNPLDARLQRPEYLGGGTIPVNITPVTQNTQTLAEGTPQGNLAAYGTAAGQNKGFTKSFLEHSIVISLASVRADLTYQQGLPRQFSRRTKYDFYWPALAHLGEQAVLNKEIYVQNTAEDENVFGYQERWAEYRYSNSLITGKFRSTDPQSLDVWHLSQEFASLPTLSDTFIIEQPPIDRVIAVTNEPQFIFDSYFDIKCARPMPVYSVPGLIDHL